MTIHAALGDGALQMSFATGIAAQGVHVDGAPLAELPEWQDFLPAFLAEEEEAEEDSGTPEAEEAPTRFRQGFPGRAARHLGPRAGPSHRHRRQRAGQRDDDPVHLARCQGLRGGGRLPALRRHFPDQRNRREGQHLCRDTCLGRRGPARGGGVAGRTTSPASRRSRARNMTGRRPRRPRRQRPRPGRRPLQGIRSPRRPERRRPGRAWISRSPPNPMPGRTEKLPAGPVAGMRRPGRTGPRMRGKRTGLPAMPPPCRFFPPTGRSRRSAAISSRSTGPSRRTSSPTATRSASASRPAPRCSRPARTSLVNDFNAWELGFQYDLIIVGGNMIDATIIKQMNILLDSDRFEVQIPAEASGGTIGRRRRGAQRGPAGGSRRRDGRDAAGRHGHDRAAGAVRSHEHCVEGGDHARQVHGGGGGGRRERRRDRVADDWNARAAGDGLACCRRPMECRPRRGPVPR